MLAFLAIERLGVEPMENESHLSVIINVDQQNMEHVA
jgi:hypothetical protein